MSDDIARLGLYIDSSGVIRANKELRKMQGRSEKAEKSTKKLTKSVGGLGVALGALGLGAAMRSVLRSTVEQEKAIAQLDAAVKSTGMGAGFTSKELQTMAGSLQDVSTFGDEAIISMQSVLLTFTKLQGDILPRTTQAVLDLSARMGQDLQSSAVMLGKALNDPVANLGALGRAGIQFTDDQEKVIKSLAKTGDMAGAQRIILKELETQFGGSARAARDTFGGALDGLSNAFGDLMEEDGDGMIDAKNATEELTAILKDPATKAAFSSITGGVISLTAALVKGVTALNQYGTAIGRDLAVALNGAMPSLDQINGKIETVSETLVKLKKKRDDALKEAPSFFDFITNDSSELNTSISEMEARLVQLEAMKARFADNAPAAVATVTTDADTKTKEDELEAARLHQEELNRVMMVGQALALGSRMDHAEDMKSIAEMQEAANTEIAIKGLNNIATLMSTGSKKMFIIGKAAALASAVISGLRAAQDAYATGMAANIGNPAAPAIAAAYKTTSLVATGVQVAAIASTQMKGQAHAGMDSVPSEGSYNLQKGEMVLDPGTSQQVRDNVTGGGASVTMHITATDAASFADQLTDGSDSIVNIITDWMSETGVSFA